MLTLRSRDLRSTIDLELMRSSYKYVDAYRREDFNGIVIFALTWIVQKLLAKKLPGLQVPQFLKQSLATLLILIP